MEQLKSNHGLLLPQNPSRGRTIVGGRYLIDGMPLHKTSFADDPDYPAIPTMWLPCSASHDFCIRCVCRSTDRIPQGIVVGEASNLTDVQIWAEEVKEQVVPAGGADFFTAIVEARGLRVKAHRSSVPRSIPPVRLRQRLSVSSKLITRAGRELMVTCPMPDDVFNGEALCGGLQL
jgi:hypothetical protein